MKAIILAAGKGSRLLPLTLETPKPLIKIGDKTIIDMIFESLPEEIEEVVIVVKHLKEKIRNYLGTKFHGKKIIFVEQGDKKGTFSALISTKDYFNDGERFLVLNGDDIHDKYELSEYLKYPRSFGVQNMKMPNYYNIILDEEGYVKEFKQQNNPAETDTTLVATGAYLLDSNIFKHPGVIIYGGEYGLPQTILEQKDEYPIMGILTQKWVPINSFEDLKKARKQRN